MSLVILLSLIAISNPLEISLWVDRQDGVYHPGDNLFIYFSASQDCFVALYDIEQGGGVSRIFPPEAGDGWIKGGQTYQIPAQSADYDYVVSGPEGVETMIAMASRERLPALNDEGPDIVTEMIDVQIKELAPAELIIVSTPDKCRIYITEAESGVREYVGKTPRGIVLRPGEYFVEIKKVGCRPLERSVSLVAGENRKVFVRLSGY
jgi:hypothetical protein